MSEEYIIIPAEEALRRRTPSEQELEKLNSQPCNKESFKYDMGLQMRCNSLVSAFSHKCSEAAKIGKRSYCTYAYYDSSEKLIISDLHYSFCI